MLLAHLLPVAAWAACPADWTAINASCYRLTTSTASHRGCVELCGAGASLACIGSAEENAQLTALIKASGIPTSVWIGHYQVPGSAEPSGGWSACSSGEETDFTSWAHNEPGINEPNNEGDQWTPIHPQNCAALKFTGIPQGSNGKYLKLSSGPQNVIKPSVS